METRLRKQERVKGDWERNEMQKRKEQGREKERKREEVSKGEQNGT